MRVAIVHHQFKLKGGMETYLCNLIRGFNQQDDNVTLYIYKYNAFKNAPLCQIQRKNLSFLPRTWRKYWFAYRIHQQKDIHKNDLKIALMRAYYQDIVICGGTHRGFLRHAKKGHSWRDKIEIACERKSYRTASWVLAHSPMLKEELIQLYQVPADKIIMCYPPVDTNLFNQSLRERRGELRKRFNIPSEKIALLFPSTGHKRKGLSVLLEALKLLPANQYELVVAGNPPAKSDASLVHYVGFVENMADLYSACDMTLLPSHYEPFGLVAVESVQCGTPVIISKQVGAKDLITPQEGIILEEISPQEIAKAIMQLAQQLKTIPTNFAERKGLTIEAHIQALKQIRGLI